MSGYLASSPKISSWNGSSIRRCRMRSLPSGWNTFFAKLGFKRMRSSKRSARSPMCRALRIESLENRRVLATVSVNTLADLVDVDPNVTSIPALVASPGADGKISLREAVAAAASSGDTINFDSTLNGGTITLDRAFQGEIAFGKSLTIDAGGLPNGITVDADDPTPTHTGAGIRVFNITDPSNGIAPPLVTLVGLTLEGGDVSFSAPSGPEGGAIRSAARLVVRDSTIQGSEADLGGAIFLAVAGGGSTPREVAADREFRDPRQLRLQ
ncbi:MAG: hypothetical protein IT424_02170 [Pirellulales bacterium]|nr:hypothetical protein [Pirellulales bacterium]